MRVISRTASAGSATWSMAPWQSTQSKEPSRNGIVSAIPRTSPKRAPRSAMTSRERVSIAGDGSIAMASTPARASAAVLRPSAAATSRARRGLPRRATLLVRACSLSIM
jgi:hypothetical protein